MVRIHNLPAGSPRIPEKLMVVAGGASDLKGVMSWSKVSSLVFRF